MRLQSHKMRIHLKKYFLRDTDAASNFACSNKGINLPKCFPPFPSNFTAVQILFKWYIRNKPFSACLCIWGLSFLYLCSPQGCPNNSKYDMMISSQGSFCLLYHMKDSQLHNYLTCPITFLAAVLPCSLGKPSPGSSSQEGIAKIYATFQRTYS